MQISHQQLSQYAYNRKPYETPTLIDSKPLVQQNQGLLQSGLKNGPTQNDQLFALQSQNLIQPAQTRNLQLSNDGLFDMNQVTLFFSSHIQMQNQKTQIQGNPGNLFLDGNDNYYVAQLIESANQFQLILTSYKEYFQDLQAQKNTFIYSFGSKQRDLIDNQRCILDYQLITSYKIFKENVVPLISICTKHLREIQDLINSNKINAQAIPANKYHDPNAINIVKYQNFCDECKALVEEIESFDTRITNLVHNAKIYQSDPLNANKLMETLKEFNMLRSELEYYMASQLTQGAHSLLEFANYETSKLIKDFTVQHLQQTTFGTKYFLERCWHVQGIVEKFQEIKDQSLRPLMHGLEQYQQRTIYSISDFLGQMIDYEEKVQILKGNLKINNEQELVPLFQNLQRKMKKKNLMLSYELEKQLGVLREEATLMFKVEQEAPKFQAKVELAQRTLAELTSLSSLYCNQYIDQKKPIPAENLRVLKDQLIKLEEVSCILEEKFCFANQIQKVTSPKILEFYNRRLQKEFAFRLNWSQIAKDYSHLIFYQCQDQEMLENFKNLLHFKWPQFSWSHSFQIEETNFQLLRNQQQLVSEAQSKYKRQQLSQDLRIVKQLNTFLNDLREGIRVIDSYLQTRQAVERHQLTILTPISLEGKIINSSLQVYQGVVSSTNKILGSLSEIYSLDVLERIKAIFDSADHGRVQSELVALKNTLQRLTVPGQLQQEVFILCAYIEEALKHFENDLDLLFCRTSSYQQLENEFGGFKAFISLNKQHERFRIQQQIARHFLDFFELKTKRNFQDLLKLKLTQSEQGNSQYDPHQLANRTDLLFDFIRKDMNTCRFLTNEIETIRHISSNHSSQEQVYLRDILKRSRELFVWVTQEMGQVDNLYDIQAIQSQITAKIRDFQELDTLQNDLTEVNPMLDFHTRLMNWQSPGQCQNTIVSLGIVHQQVYADYLAACRRVFSVIAPGSLILVDSLNLQDLNRVKFKMLTDTKAFRLAEMEAANGWLWLYKDYQSILIKKAAQRIQIEILDKEQTNVVVNGVRIQGNLFEI